MPKAIGSLRRMTATACSMTINYLKKKDIPFTVKDIEKNPDYMKEMIKKSGSYRGVPVLDINGKTYLGFHPSIIDGWLGHQTEEMRRRYRHLFPEETHAARIMLFNGEGE